jgi:hypothetical protein
MFRVEIQLDDSPTNTTRSEQDRQTDRTEQDTKQGEHFCSQECFFPCRELKLDCGMRTVNRRKFPQQTRARTENCLLRMVAQCCQRAPQAVGPGPVLGLSLLDEAEVFGAIKSD